MPDQNLPNTPPLSFPDVADVPSMPPAAPATAPENLDIPPMIAEPKIPKKKSGRIIATILGILLLVGAVGAGVVLVGQKQLFQQKAREAEPCKVCEGKKCVTIASGVSCTPSLNECSTNSDCQPPSSCTPSCEGNIPYTCKNGKLLRGAVCTNKQVCNNGVCVTPPTTCSLTGDRICVGNVETGPCYQGGQGGEYACHKLAGDYGRVISDCANGDSTCSCSCPSTMYTWKAHENGHWWCFDTAAGTCDGQYPYAERCSLQKQQCTGGTPTPTPPPGATPTPTPTPPAAACTVVKAYDTNWNQLTAAQLSALTAGSVVRFTISGTPAGQIDKARFTINGVLGSEVTTKKPGTDEYYTEYTIPAGIYSFTVTAQIHHLTLGWF